MNQQTADKILSQTEAGYDSISKKFSQTRKHFWRGLEHLKSYCSGGGNVLDYGCGNGRLMELIGHIPDVSYFGVDVSQRLIDFANNGYKQPNVHFFKIDPVQATLPFQDNFFNTVYSIAVFHHFPSEKYRQRIAEQLYAATAKDGTIIVTVWYLWQKKYFKHIAANWIMKLFGKSDVDWNDCWIPFADNNGEKFQRFHRAFTKKELTNLFESVGFEIESCDVTGGRNIVLVGRKH